MAEKQYKRFNDNDAITQGTANTNLQATDIVPVQHLTGDNNDKKVDIRQLMAIPQIYVNTYSSGVATPVFLNMPEFEPVLGQQFDITFGTEYTGDTAPSIRLKDGTGSKNYPIRANGAVVGKGFNKIASSQQRSMRATIRTSATTATTAQTKTNWYIDLDSNVVSVIDNVITYSDGTTSWTGSKINSALTNLISVDTNITLTSAVEGLSFSNVNIRKTDISGKKVYSGSFKVEQNTISAYFQIYVSGITAPSYVMGFWETSIGNYGIIQDMSSDSRQFWFRTKSGEVIQANTFSNTTIRFIVFEL